MNETVEQENPATQEEREERTFTQSEMDAMNRAKPVAPYGTTGCPPKRACHSPQEEIRPERQPTYHLILLLLLAARKKDASCDASFLIRIPKSYCSKPRRRGRSRRRPRF